MYNLDRIQSVASTIYYIKISKNKHIMFYLMNVFWYFVSGYFTLGTANYLYIYNKQKHSKIKYEYFENNDLDQEDLNLILI